MASKWASIRNGFQSEEALVLDISEGKEAYSSASLPTEGAQPEIETPGSPCPN
jgi:hypothetical protein